MAATPFGRGPSGKSGSGRAHDIGSSPSVRQFTSFASDIDLTTQLPQTDNSVSRKIIVSNIGVGSKLLILTLADGTTQSLDVSNLQGVALEIQARTIKSTTTVTSVLVFY